MDSETTIPGREERPLRIPGVASIRMRRIRFSSPMRFYREGRLISEDEAIELLVQTTASMPIRDVTPVLFIGDIAVTHYERVGTNLYRFLAYGVERLPRGARISIGWPFAPNAKIPTPFVFDPGTFPAA